MANGTQDNLFGGEWDDGDVGASGVLITGGRLGQDGQLSAVETKVLSHVKLPGHTVKPKVTPELEGLAEQARQNVRNKVATGEIVIGASQAGLAVSMTSAINDEFNALLAARTQAVQNAPAIRSPASNPTVASLDPVPRSDKLSDWSGVTKKKKDIDVRLDQDDTPVTILVQLENDDTEIRFVCHDLVGLGTRPADFEGIVFVQDNRYVNIDKSLEESLLSLQGEFNVSLYGQDGQLSETDGTIMNQFTVVTPLHIYRYLNHTHILILYL